MRGGHMIAGEKPAKGVFKQSMLKLLKYCKKYYGVMILAILLGAVSVVCQIISPSKLGDLTEVIIGGIASGGSIDIDQVTSLALLILTLALIMAVFNYFQQFIMATTTQKIVYNFSRRYGALPGSPGSWRPPPPATGPGRCRHRRGWRTRR